MFVNIFKILILITNIKMFKKVILGGIAASAIGFHYVNNTQTKETFKKYCPALTKCCEKTTKNKDCKK